DLERHRQVFARGRPTEHRRSPAAPAGYGGFVAVSDDLFSFLDRDAMLGDVLNVSFRVLFQVPDALDVRYRAVFQWSCVILQEQVERMRNLAARRRSRVPGISWALECARARSRPSSLWRFCWARPSIVAFTSSRNA